MLHKMLKKNLRIIMKFSFGFRCLFWSRVPTKFLLYFFTWPKERPEYIPSLPYKKNCKRPKKLVANKWILIIITLIIILNIFAKNLREKLFNNYMLQWFFSVDISKRNATHHILTGYLIYFKWLLWKKFFDFKNRYINLTKTNK